MPTIRPRYQVTETAEVAAALDLAAREWPGEPRSRLLLRLVEQGRAVLEQQQAAARDKRLEAIDRYRGQFGDAFPPGYLEELRRDWPE